MDRNELKNRTKTFAVNVFRFSETLPDKNSWWSVARQIIRSSSSVAANYRAVCRARSDREFIAKLSIVIEEADETMFWLEYISEIDPHYDNEILKNLTDEINQLTAIFVSSIKTVKSRLNQKF